MVHRLFILLSFFILLIPSADCSSDGVSCGGSFCGNNEVCENGECVLGLVIHGDSEENQGCKSDKDCEEDMICTGAQSEPSRTCIMSLPCNRDGDCQSGLVCGSGGVCR